MRIIVGLGNPGSKYQYTRHNVGFLMIDYIAAQYNINMKDLKHKALLGSGIIQGEKVILVKPQTFMNLSGESIRDILSYYKLSAAHLVVIYDDVSLDVGKLRIRKKGSDGGHNGIKNIIYNIESDVFDRIKIGIGENTIKERSLADYVLSNFSKDENFTDVAKKTLLALETILTAGAEVAMNKFNSNEG